MQITKLGNPSHGDLPGLGDDDHTQYLLVDGSRHADSLIIDGNLTVSGSTVTMDVTNMTVEDNIVVYNKGETASGVTLGTAGLQIDRGLLTDAQLLWNETTDTWQVGIVGSLFNIVTTTGTSMNHDELGELLDDDHTQYLLANGSRELTANWNAGDFTISAHAVDLTCASGVWFERSRFMWAPAGCGTRNTSIGIGAGDPLAGANNILIGNQAGANAPDGASAYNDNVYIGYQAGANVSGTYARRNVYIGTQAGEGLGSTDPCAVPSRA